MLPQKITGKLKYLRCVSGNVLDSDRDFLRKLKERMFSLKEVFSVEECDFILLFCSVASRAQSDIAETLKKLRHISDSKPAVLVVLHHTFDPGCPVPDSSRAVPREETLTVDCLFHEDRGLLRCQRNQEALERVKQWIKLQSFQVKQQHQSQTSKNKALYFQNSLFAQIKEKFKGKAHDASMCAELTERNKRLEIQLQNKSKSLGETDALLTKIKDILAPIINENHSNLEETQLKCLSGLLSEIDKELDSRAREVKSTEKKLVTTERENKLLQINMQLQSMNENNSTRLQSMNRSKSMQVLSMDEDESTRLQSMDEIYTSESLSDSMGDILDMMLKNHQESRQKGGWFNASCVEPPQNSPYRCIQHSGEDERPTSDNEDTDCWV